MSSLPNNGPSANVPDPAHLACNSPAICRFLKLLAAHNASPTQVLEVEKAINRALPTVPWVQILFAMLPFILSIFTGGTIDFAALIAAILALLKPTTH